MKKLTIFVPKKMKRAIIIGATSGIGKEVAQRLLSEGWQIGIAGKTPVRLSKSSGKSHRNR